MMVWGWFRRDIIGRRKDAPQDEMYRLEASIRSAQPTGLDFDDLATAIEATIAEEVKDIQLHREDQHTYSLCDSSDAEYLTLELSYFPSEEILDWEEQRQLIHSAERRVRTDKATLTVESSRVAPVEMLVEYLTTTDAYTVSFDRYSNR